MSDRSLSLDWADRADVLDERAITEIDIWRAANFLIRQHGADAELEAARLADVRLDRGDSEGRLLWLRIRRAIEALHARPSGKPN
jgi:hypothetical protein